MPVHQVKIGFVGAIGQESRSVVDQEVERAELCRYLFDQPAAGFGMLKIAAEYFRGAAPFSNLARQRIRRIVGTIVVNCDPEAVSRQVGRNRRSDPLCSVLVS